MKCTEARSRISGYLDGIARGTEMRQISQHLDNCRTCNTHAAMLRQTKVMVASLGRKQPPPELALRLRIALSREAATVRRPRFDAILPRLQDAVNAFMVPATAGVLSAIIFFGLLTGYFFAIPSPLQASADDVPTMLFTNPELASSPLGSGLSTINADSLVVDVYVDANGRVQDYRILSAPDDETELTPKLKNMLLFTVFRPATAFGRPRPGRALLSFAKINVKG